ncbi:MAG: hypothetical protein VYA86_01475 [Candidatus Thermoplasmatota archaeon]|nr:hypothetical protein [Candidatus Thermoplasmatota archaeon]
MRGEKGNLIDSALRGRWLAGIMPGAWWLLLSICSVLGVGTWYLRNFTENDELMRLVAFSGIACMISLVAWTWTMDI